MTLVRRWLAQARSVSLGVAALVAILPLLFMVITAVRQPSAYFASPFGVPSSLDFNNFGQAVGLSVGRWMINSLIVTVVSVTVAMVLAICAGYALVRLPVPGRRFILSTTAALMLIPSIVLVVPLFVFMSSLGLVDNLASVTIIYAGIMFPFSTFLFARFINVVPEEVFDAAKIDGAPDLVILWRIVVPLARPILFTIVAVNALYAWNELLIASVFLQSTGRLTLQAGLALLEGKNNTNVPLVMASALISVAPILILYLFGQRYFVRGLVEGAVK